MYDCEMLFLCTTHCHEKLNMYICVVPGNFKNVHAYNCMCIGVSGIYYRVLHQLLM